ncbi:hypothetical protein DPMN_166976 [Dreissena polymorpha]|uniref:Uncharacterized protein n=1 Tax=Dreissena polymorpha TaxID=45954 RepID=A0A9D4EXW3_DREPO|nr:hypothetical protein DPMN_166976 [Dreissena polymorpha]
MATAATAKHSGLWASSFHATYRLYKYLLVFILLYGCESWTLNADTGYQPLNINVSRTVPHPLHAEQDQ